MFITCTACSQIVSDELLTALFICIWRHLYMSAQGEDFVSGEVGDWKNWITVAQNERFDDVIERRFEGTGIVFTYE